MSVIGIEEEIVQAVEDTVRAMEFLRRPSSLQFIQDAARLISDCFARGGKILIAGNGGSLCDAMHFAEELTGQFRHRRPALPAIALSDPGHLTCVSNDMGFDEVFARAVEALGRPEDVLVGLTTSGNSPNIIKAVSTAKSKGMATVVFLGKTGGALKGVCDIEWIVEGFPYSDRIQEAHMAAIHIIIEMIEKILFHDLGK
ncbi:MAG: SIS domain-containing protein [Verrucomicrobia bacterium]|nr:SIS domain-containing protein [Verrucomicrobiota bacterium]